MPGGVVDRLEAVEVDEEHRGRLVVPARMGEELPGTVEDQ